MKKFLYFLLFLPAVAASEPPPLKWIPVPSEAKQKVYANSYTLKPKETAHGSVIIAEILMPEPAPKNKTLDNKPIVYNSVVRRAFISCDKGLLRIIHDIYFAEAMPTRANTPIGGLDYTSYNAYEIMNKSSSMYQFFCNNTTV